MKRGKQSIESWEPLDCCVHSIKRNWKIYWHQSIVSLHQLIVRTKFYMIKWLFLCSKRLMCAFCKMKLENLMMKIDGLSASINCLPETFYKFIHLQASNQFPWTINRLYLWSSSKISFLSPSFPVFLCAQTLQMFFITWWFITYQ